MTNRSKKASHVSNRNWLVLSEPAGIQTPTLLIRSQMLYSVKLQARILGFAQK